MIKSDNLGSICEIKPNIKSPDRLEEGTNRQFTHSTLWIRGEIGIFRLDSS